MEKNLLDFHRDRLVDQSGISPDVIEERGYYTVSRDTPGHPDVSSNHLKALGIKASYREPARLPGIVIPMFDSEGKQVTCQFRPEVPPSHGPKYISPSGKSIILDVHPRWSRDPWSSESGAGVDDALVLPAIKDIDRELWVTEGVKKADCLTSRDIVTVALSGVFNWRRTIGASALWEDIPLKGRRVVICFDADARSNRNVLQAMVRLGGFLRTKQAKVRYLIVPEKVGDTPVKGVDDYLAAGGQLDELPIENESPEIPKDLNPEFTDAAIAEQFYDEMLAESWIYVSGLGWHAWDGQKWGPQPDQSILESHRLWTREGLVQAIQAGAAGGVQEAWLGRQAAGKIRAVIGLCEGIALVDASMLDAHSDLLNTPSGIVDLRTGEIRPHDPQLLMTRITAVKYLPGYRSEKWEKALEAIPEDSRKWAQMRFGQAVTGRQPSDDRAILALGGGENAKSTVLDGTANAAGTYHKRLADRAILGTAGAHTTELTDFRGARYTSLEELPQEEGNTAKLDMDRLKKLCGTQEMTARKMKQDTITFRLTHSLIFSCNTLPLVVETDHGSWRRLAVLPFPYRYVAESELGQRPNNRLRDRSIRDAIRNNDQDILQAILAWMVAGAVMAFDDPDGFETLPPSVQAATSEWRRENDMLGSFVEDYAELDNDSAVLVSEFNDAFRMYQTGKGRPWMDKLIATRMSGHALLGHLERGKLRAGGNSVKLSTSKIPENAPTQGEQVRVLYGLRWRDPQAFTLLLNQ